jgi:hypothetical protein
MLYKQKVQPLNILRTCLTCISKMTIFAISSRHQRWKGSWDNNLPPYFTFSNMVGNVWIWGFEVSFHFLGCFKYSQEKLIKQHWLMMVEFTYDQIIKKTLKSHLKCKISCTNMWWSYHNWYTILNKYVMLLTNDWDWIPILMSLEHSTKGCGNNNLIKIIMGAFNCDSYQFLMLPKICFPLKLME